MQQIPTRTLVAVPYDQMVRNLFKPMGSNAATMMHAAIGIAGEAAELMLSHCIENIAEELGDLEFYIEAYYQQLGGRDFEEELVIEKGDPSAHQVLSSVTIAIVSTAGKLLDLTKKAWVEGSPLNVIAVRYELMRLEVMMDCMRDLVGIRRADILGANQAKLGKRYPEGVYTDAPVRADTAGASEFD